MESRPGLVDLINKLKSNLLYRKEIIKRKEDEKRNLEKQSLVTEPEDLVDNEEKKSPEASDVYKCAICSCEFSRAKELQAHYALTHLKEKLKDKFAHLVQGSRCKLCKETSSDEDEMFVHIATSHDKINIILKENDLPTVVVQTEEKETNMETERAVNNNKEEEEEDDDKLEALEKKIKQVQDQMSTSVKSNLEVYALADIKDLEDGNITEKEEEVEEEKVPLKKSKKTKRRRGRPRKKSESQTQVRRSSRSTGGGPEVPETERGKERRESRSSCKRCGQWSLPSNRVVGCPGCGQGWHQACLSPALLTRPSPAWLCPLCCHLELVASLDQLLTELDILTETVEQKRLEELQVNLIFIIIILILIIAQHRKTNPRWSKMRRMKTRTLRIRGRKLRLMK